jgi:hypothetical protein
LIILFTQHSNLRKLLSSAFLKKWIKRNWGLKVCFQNRFFILYSISFFFKVKSLVSNYENSDEELEKISTEEEEESENEEEINADENKDYENRDDDLVNSTSAVTDGLDGQNFEEATNSVYKIFLFQLDF